MAPALPPIQNPAQSVAVLTPRLWDADPDIRYMSLNDLKSIFDGTQAAFLGHDYMQCAKIVDGFLHTLVDTNGEVQNLTIKCLGSFVLKTDPKILSPLVHKLSDLTIENTIDSSIPALAVRAVVVALPRPTPFTARTQAVSDAYATISKVLIPRLVGYIVVPQGDKQRPAPPKGLLEEDLEKGTDSNFIDVLTEIAKCFGPMLQSQEIQALQEITLQLLESERTSSIMKKKAVVALATLAHYFSDTLLSSTVSHFIESMSKVYLTTSNRKLYVTVLGAMARAIPQKMGPYLKTVAPFVFSALSQEELDAQIEAAAGDDYKDTEIDDMREAALASLDNFLSSCTSDMVRFSDDSISATLRFLRYDPNVAIFGEDEEDDDADDVDSDFDADEDFEEEGGADDENELSWKVRRGAAKALHTIISVRSSGLLDNAEKYDRIAGALIERMKEREDSVRLEILSALSLIIRKTGEAELQSDAELANGLERSLKIQSLTKKRRRGDSDVSMSDSMKAGRYTGSASPEAHSPPRMGPPASLAKVGPEILQGALKLLKTSTIATKQASIIVVKDLVVAQGGGIADQLANVFGALIELLEAQGADTRSTATLFAGNSGSVSATTLQAEALQLTAEIAKTHSSSTLVSHISKLVPAVAKLARNQNPKVSCEALLAIEQLVKAITPPRSASTSSTSSKQLLQLYAVTAELVQSRSVDLAVRRQALHVLGTLLGRTFGSNGAKLIPQKERAEALELLYESSRNETSRYAAIKAIDAVAELAPTKAEFEAAWFGKVVLELGSQLRKADRALRGSSLKTLRTLTSIQANVRKLEKTACSQLVHLLLPLLSIEDLHLLGPALLILAALVEYSPNNIVDEEFNKQICQLLLGSAAGQVLRQLLELTTTIGERKAGQPLMNMLLRDVGINGGPAVVGKVIGSLLVAGGSSVGVKVDDFLNELKQAKDARRKCLALSILGEVGHRSGDSGQLSPDLFISHFKNDSSDVSLAAAVALGRVSASNGNVQSYVPMILERAQNHPEEQYLVLHSIKEILVDHHSLKSNLGPFTNPLWQMATAASQNDENRTIAAECLSSLTILDPTDFLPKLQTLVTDTSALVRSTGILAFRDVISGSDASYDKFLRPLLVEALTIMMKDADLENRRSALNSFNAAVRTKQDLVLPYLGHLLPLVIESTFVDPKLIREVSMGPFKHKVDDGLEMRKSAYETLYAVMDSYPSRIDVVALYDRVVEGFSDEHAVRGLCNLILLKLITVAPEETIRRLEALTDKFRMLLAEKAKENAVRHEVEKIDESKKGVVKISLELSRAFPGEASTGVPGQGATRPKWSSYLDDMKRDHSLLVKDMEKEIREKERV